MSKSALNSTLQRPILEGTMYSALFSSSKCTLTDLGKGDTEFTINKMKEWVLKSQQQLDTKLVQQLFSKPALQATATNIHYFLYNHFQYKADGADQNLRSPNCAWQQRRSGIDCKTYSIIASVLLLKCNLIHYIRRIKQPNFNPTQYTHVYVVVPFDQVNGDLTKGHYTIDGTLPTMHEPAQLKPDDIFMSKMSHYGLMGALPTATQQPTLTDQKDVFLKKIAANVSRENFVKINSFISQLIQAKQTPFYAQTELGWNVSGLDIILSKGLNGNVTDSIDLEGIDFGGLWDSIAGFFGNVSCWGGSAFDGATADSVGNKITAHYTKVIVVLNTAVANNDVASIATNYLLFNAVAQTTDERYKKKLSEGWNKCTADSIRKMINTNAYFKDTVYTAITHWLKQYFNISELGLTAVPFYQNELEKVPYGFYFTSVGGVSFNREFKQYSFTAKQGDYSINAFEFSPYLAEAAANPITFNPDQFISTLSTVIATSPNPTTGTGSGTTSGTTTGTGIIPPPPVPTTKKSGMSTVVGVGLVLAALGYGISEYKKSQNTTSKTADKDAK